MDRPRIIVGGFMSADGKTAPKNRHGRLFHKFMSNELFKRLHKIRSEADAVLVGLGTVLEDNPLLMVRATEGKNPIRVVLDSEARTPLSAAVANTKDAPTIIAVSQSAPREKLDALRKLGVEVIECGETRVDIRKLVEGLYRKGVRTLLVEGGAEVRWSFIKEGLVDELFVWVAPVVWGGRQAPTLVDGEGFETVEEATRLNLTQVDCVEGVVLLTFTVGGTRYG